MQPKRVKTADQALASLMRLAARSERSTGDARRLMARWGVEQTEREGVLRKITEMRFIDDRRYAEAYVKDKTHLSGWGAHRVRAGLRSKGVPAEIIEDTLRGLDPDASRAELTRRLEKRRAQLRDEDVYKLKTKLIRYGLSLGYDYEAVRPAVDEMV